MQFKEDSRVKIPAILHLTRLGYIYLSLKNAIWNTDNNIFTDIIVESDAKINPGLGRTHTLLLLDQVSLCLENEESLMTFYNKINPIFKKQDCIALENQHLASLSD